MSEDEELSENIEKEVPETSEPEIKDEEAGTSEEPETPKIQQRFNKLTAEKYDQKRRADAAEKELAELKAVPVTGVTGAPTLEKFDYDDAKFNEASIKYHVDRAIAESTATQRTATATAQRNASNQEFARKIATSGIEDYSDIITNLVQTVPLSEGIIDAIQQRAKGPELAYYLGKHLDIADRLAGIDPITAALELGKISAGLSGKKTKKTSNAPKPVETIGGSGGAKPKDYENMSMEEIYDHT